MEDTEKDRAKTLRKVSRQQNKLPKAQVVAPNKKKYKRKPKNNKPNECCYELHIGWPDWWMD